MDCPLYSKDTAEVLLDYCSRRLDPQTTAMLERHMEACEACHAFANAQRQVWDALDAWEPVEVSADFDQKLFARMEQEDASSVLTRWWRRWSESMAFSWRPAISVAAACLVIVTGLVLRPTEPVLPDAGKSGHHLEAVDIEQVETALEDMEMLKQLQWTGPAKSQGL
jgi:anti-sigma factor RsiW